MLAEVPEVVGSAEGACGIGVAMKRFAIAAKRTTLAL
jgi:hypothetical protein